MTTATVLPTRRVDLPKLLAVDAAVLLVAAVVALALGAAVVAVVAAVLAVDLGIAAAYVRHRRSRR